MHEIAISKDLAKEFAIDCYDAIVSSIKAEMEQEVQNEETRPTDEQNEAA